MPADQSRLLLTIFTCFWFSRFSGFVSCSGACAVGHPADPEAPPQREEGHPGRQEGQQVLRAPQAQQQRCQEVARRTEGTGGRDRDSSQLPREGERHPARPGGHAARGGQLTATTAAAEALPTLRSYRGHHNVSMT